MWCDIVRIWTGQEGLLRAQKQRLIESAFTAWFSVGSVSGRGGGTGEKGCGNWGLLES